MTRYLRLWYAFFANCLVRDMQFRTNFILRIGMAFTWYVSNILFFDVIYLHVPGIAGWSRYEVVILLGGYYIIDALNVGLFVNNVFKLPQYVNRGELDFMLLKPVSAQFLVSVRYVDWSSVVAMLGGIATVAWGLMQLGVTPSFFDVGLYVVLLVCGLVLVYAMNFIYQCTSFWFLTSAGLENGFWMVEHFIMKPDTIYPRFMKILLTYVIPATVIAAVPARALLDKALAPEMIAWAAH